MKKIQDFISKDLKQLDETLKLHEANLIYLRHHQDGSVISGIAEGEQAFFLKTGNKVFLDAQLQEEHKQSQDEIRQIKEECNEALTQFIAHFNSELCGSGWSINRHFYKQNGFRRSLLEFVIPDTKPYAKCLDKDGNTDLTTPSELIAIASILQQYQAEIFRAQLKVSLGRKPATTVRGPKI